MNQCDRHHNCLPSNSEDRKLPSRLVHLGIDDSEIRIVETRDNSSVGRYACLSHCWGRPELMETFKTTSQNYSNRLQSIPSSQIPRTFGEAFTVTRALGIGYIWIDSICIIQDDLADWTTEAANMHLIYENSHITIGATSSHGPDGGLNLDHSTDIFRQSGTASSGATFSVMGRVHPRHPNDRLLEPHSPDRSINGHCTYQRPLMYRAWALQERLLSPRFLHFTSQEMIWECKTDILCECGSSKSGRCRSTKQAFHKSLDSPEDISKTWHTVVEAYSNLDLTEESDKLHALSGLASKVAAARQLDVDSHYLAGLWGDSIYHDLLWKVSSGSKELPRRRAANWRAPTWSWASLDWLIRFPISGDVTRLCHADCKALDAGLESPPAAGDEWGQVTKWSLTIRGLLFSVRIHVEVENLDGFQMVLEDDPENIVKSYHHSLDISLDTDTLEDLSFFKDNTVFCMPITHLHHFEGCESEHSLILGFDHGSNKYRRLGIISHNFENGRKSPFAQGGEERMVEIV